MQIQILLKIWELKSVVYGTDGSRSDYLKVENNRLIMNGRQIFNFAALEVAPHIKEALNRENLSAEDIDLYCLHQGSAAIIDTISKRYANISDRFMKDMATTGNTVSSSIPLLLEKTINAQAITRILISGFGVGLSIATAIIAKASED